VTSVTTNLKKLIGKFIAKRLSKALQKR